MKINIEELKFKIKIIEDEKLKAIVAINLGDLSIKGFRIMDSKFVGKHGEKLWVVPPSYNSGTGYKPIVYFQKDIWEAIQVAMIKEYERRSEKYTNEKMNGMERIKKEELFVPF